VGEIGRVVRYGRCDGKRGKRECGGEDEEWEDVGVEGMEGEWGNR